STTILLNSGVYRLFGTPFGIKITPPVKHYIILSNKWGAVQPGDIWDIIPEDTQGRKAHFAPYPEDLCKTPIILTCPPSGIVLDPFVGTGTSCLVAEQFGRKSIGIDIADEYLNIARKRCNNLEYEQISFPITEE
ncbi:DNA methyltransferase, partial [Hominenteromicrobium sp.]|uniref:DNA methyltransferase n=1 Tax=Hominenteromicrobium sp. TaxID=3073581 RepID=UPI003AEF3EEC